MHKSNSVIFLDKMQAVNKRQKNHCKHAEFYHEMQIPNKCGKKVENVSSFVLLL